MFTGRLELSATGASGWGAWRVVGVSGERALGTVELTAPDASGAVQCRVALDDKAQRNGHAAEALGGLIDWVFSHPEVRRIVADARRDQPAAIRVLERNGLSHVGDGDEPGTLRFALARP